VKIARLFCEKVGNGWVTPFLPYLKVVYIIEIMVGGIGIEPTTTWMSTKFSPATSVNNNKYLSTQNSKKPLGN
jgi:hypothetical protein